jgi:GH15 family glucan-1,4-alpha-glucosidase
MEAQPPLEDYALIGDCETAALVSRSGSIDWLCWPRFDSSACFAALLGTPEHGRWQIAPAGGVTETQRRYLGETLILETVFRTAGGAVSVVDFMPLRGTGDSRCPEVVRMVTGQEGAVPMKMVLALRFDYGRIVPWTTEVGDGRIHAVAGQHAAILEGSVPVHEEEQALVAQFTVREGQRVSFALTYEASHLPLPDKVDVEAALKATREFWSEWSGRGRYDGPWKEAVSRSLITIKALTYKPTGGVLAALTTSLPETIGGERNWDYRYCWLRDTMFTLQSLVSAGYRDEAAAWSDWLLRAVAGKSCQIQPLYGIAGEHRTPELELPWLPGYHGSRPVRTGNAAYAQYQVDVFGSVMDTLHAARQCGIELREAAGGLQTQLMEQLEQQWQDADDGIWEVRSGQQHFVHSKLMSWVAFDRAIHAAETFGLEGPVERWRKLRGTIHAEVLERGFDRERGAFVQAYDTDALDAAVLLIPLLGFLPPDDPRVLSTTRAIERDLCRDGLVLRYDTEKSDDGLEGEEGAFLACSMWLADNLILQGRRDDALRLFKRVLALRNDVGLLAEQYDVTQGRLVGNFPQAFSHFSLIDTAFRFGGGGATDEAAKSRGARAAEADDQP